MVRTRNSVRSTVKTALFSNDILGNTASFLDCKDLVNLSLASKQAATAVKVVALQITNMMNTRYGGDEDLSVLEELHVLRSPIEFDHLFGNRIGHLGGDRACVYSSNPNTLHSVFYICERTMEGDWDDWSGTEQTAICTNHIMRSGKHYVKFTITTCDPDMIFRYVYCWLGIMRPVGSWWREQEWTDFPLLFIDELLGEKTDAWGESNVHCCLYKDFDGKCEWSDWGQYPDGRRSVGWNGMDEFSIYDGELGLLLDLDEGTLTVYKNNKRCGVMMSGLTGEYCWVANIIAQANGDPNLQNVRIERAPVPTS